MFVEADAQIMSRVCTGYSSRAIRHLSPTFTIQNESLRHADLGGWDFYVDTWPRGRDEPMKPGSDREAVERILKSKGYKMPAGMMYVRLVHLLDSEKRKELMIIYGEDLSSTGISGASLKEGGANFSRWPSIQKELIERAKSNVNVEPLPPH